MNKVILSLLVDVWMHFTSLACEQKPLLDCGQGICLQDLAKQLKNLETEQMDHHKTSFYFRKSYDFSCEFLQRAKLCWGAFSNNSTAASSEGENTQEGPFDVLLIIHLQDWISEFPGGHKWHFLSSWRRAEHYWTHHELLIMEGLRIHQTLGMGSALIRFGGWRDDPASCSRILSLPADSFLFRLPLVTKLCSLVQRFIILNISSIMFRIYSVGLGSSVN